MRVGAAILAAGGGTRFGREKMTFQLRGRPLWLWSYQALLSHPEVDQVGIVCSSSNRAEIETLAKDAAFISLGGELRRDSSRIAVEALASSCDLILIHDGARPFLSPTLISNVIAAAGRAGASGPALAISDTVKRLQGQELQTLDRAQLLTVQTPQAATTEIFARAHSQAESEPTDDLALIEEIGVIPELVAGDPDNIKVTSREDVRRALNILGGPEVRTGHGYDIHRFSEDPGRPLMLGGVQFEGRGLEGHSDADPIIHAAVDALLGAAGLGDIGVHFPNSDPRWKDEPSITFLRHAEALLSEANWRIVNLDLTAVAEAPKIMARDIEMRETLARALNTEPTRVSIKATTNERLGAIGREEGLAAFAVATIIERV